MNEDEKCRKSRLYGLILVLRGKIAVREEFTEIICVSVRYNYLSSGQGPLPYVAGFCVGSVLGAAIAAIAAIADITMC